MNLFQCHYPEDNMHRLDRH